MSFKDKEFRLAATQEKLRDMRGLRPIWYMGLALASFGVWLFSAAIMRHSFLDLDTGSAIFVGFFFALILTAYLSVMLSFRRQRAWRDRLLRMPIRDRQEIVTELVEYAASLSISDFLDDKSIDACDRHSRSDFKQAISKVKEHAESAARDILSDDIDRMVSGFDFLMDESTGIIREVSRLHNRARYIRFTIDQKKTEDVSLDRLENLIEPETLQKLRGSHSSTNSVRGRPNA